MASIHRSNSADDTFQGISKQYSIIFNSNDALTNTDTSPDGDAFTVTLNNPLYVPPEAKSCYVGLFQASVWNSSPNVLTGVNDVFYFTYASTEYSIVLPQGLYSLDDLNQTINAYILDTRAGTLPNNLFTFTGNTATQKVQISLNYIGSQIRFPSGSPSLFKILGFENGVNYPTSPSTFVGQLALAPNIAGFNTINNFLITTDLINNGLPVNAQSAGILAQIPITATPNSLINFNPPQIVYIQCDHLIGKARQVISFRLTDELLGKIKVLEPFNFVMTIKYEY
jgi:hypothetical protein